MKRPSSQKFHMQPSGLNSFRFHLLIRQVDRSIIKKLVVYAPTATINEMLVTGLSVHYLAVCSLYNQAKPKTFRPRMAHWIAKMSMLYRLIFTSNCLTRPSQLLSIFSRLSKCRGTTKAERKYQLAKSRFIREKNANTTSWYTMKQFIGPSKNRVKYARFALGYVTNRSGANKEKQSKRLMKISKTLARLYMTRKTRAANIVV